MKTRYYAVIPSAALLLILSNAFYGHSVFSMNHPEEMAKFSVYVRLQPEWDSHPGNLLFDVTNVWNGPDGPDGIYHDGPDSPPLDAHNYNRLQHIGERSFVELRHRFSDCQINWQPVLYRYGIDMLRNQFDALGGADISKHPYAVMYPSRPGPGPHDLSDGYVQFVPICTSKETASYMYSVRSNDGDLQFGAYFVPDYSEYSRFVQDPSSVAAYPGCAGVFYSFSGTCEGVSKDGGLLIWIPDDLDMALTKITINLLEV